MKDLTQKQEIFCNEYIIDWNATRSYKTAYPNVKNDNTAAVEGHKLLRNPKIKAYIEEIQKDLEKQAGISRLKVLNEYIKIAFSSTSDLHNEWADQIKLYDRQRALENISKMLGYNEAEKKDITTKFVGFIPDGFDEED